MKTNTKPAPTRCLRQQGFRDVLQRLSMTLMLVMLTATAAWAGVTLKAYTDGILLNTGGEITFMNNDPTSNYVKVTPNVDYAVDKVELSYIYLGHDVTTTPMNQTIGGEEYYVINLPQGVTNGTVTAYFISLNYHYTVSFYANGGDGGSMDAVTTGSSYTIPECSFTRNSHTFIGWATSPGGDVVYTPGQTIAMTGDLSLYAKWNVSSTVTFYANGGTGSMDAVMKKIGSSYEIPECGFTRSGYIFFGWATSPDGDIEYQPGKTITLKADLSLYAMWGVEQDGLNYTIISENPNRVRLIGYSGDKPTGTLTVLSNITIGGQDYSVSSIGKRAFWYCVGLTAITFPNTSELTSIGDGAFYACSGLTTIEIPDGVTIIGDATFQNCSNLTTISIPNSLISIRDCAFDNTPWKTNFLNSQPDGVVYIGKVAYTYKGTMPENTDIVLATETKGITASAFSNQSNLKSIIIPSSVTSVGLYAFNKCSGLAAIVVENGNTVYDSREGCNAIVEKATNTLIAGCKNTVIPASVTSIGKSAFKGSGLTSFTIPASVTHIGDYAFCDCKSLTSVTIPTSVTSIEDCTFQGCDKLITITIPNSVNIIGNSAYSNCKQLIAVTIPNNVSSINENAFNGCSNLSSVTIYATSVPTLGSDVFKNNNKNGRKIYVPAAKLEAYREASIWSAYANDIEPFDVIVEDGDDKSVLAALNRETKTIVLKRTFPAGKKQTVCLPFAPTVLLNHGKVWQFTSISEGKAVMTQIKSKHRFSDNTPYIFEATSEVSSITFPSVEIDISDDPKTTNAAFTFHGTYEEKHWLETDDAVVNGTIYGFMMTDNDGQLTGQFKRVRRETYLRPFSCYLEYNGELSDTNPTSQAPAHRTSAEELPDVIDIIWQSSDSDSTTGIVEMEKIRSQKEDVHAVFDMQGRKVVHPTKGLYIVNGKKIIIK